MKDLVTLIGHVTPETGRFAYRAMTPSGEYTVREWDGHWRAVPLFDRASGPVAYGSTPEDAVRKALARRALAA